MYLLLIRFPRASQGQFQGRLPGAHGFEAVDLYTIDSIGATQYSTI